MTITRVQQVTQVLSTVLPNVFLSQTPQWGNTLVVVYSCKFGGALSVNFAPTPPDPPPAPLSWTSLSTSTVAGNLNMTVMRSQKIRASVPTVWQISATFNLATYPAIFTVIEYSGLLRVGTMVDRAINNAGYLNSPMTGVTLTTTQATELWLAGIVTGCRDGTTGNAIAPHEPTLIGSGYSLVAQDHSETAVAATDDLTQTVYEKLAVATGAAQVNTQTSAAVYYGGIMLTMFGYLGAERTKTLTLNSYIVARNTQSASMNLGVATTKTRTTDLQVMVKGGRTVSTSLSVLIGSVVGPPASGAEMTGFDVLLNGPMLVTTSLDVEVFASTSLTADLDVAVGIEIRPLLANLSVTIKSEDERRTAYLDMAILGQWASSSNSTTPEASRYLTCRPLWCSVPRTSRISSVADVNVGGLATQTSEMDVLITGSDTRIVGFEVFIKPEP